MVNRETHRRFSILTPCSSLLLPALPMPRYNPATIEPKWQAYWDEHQTFAAPRMPSRAAKKLYVLDMFPYPSGDGLHVGHPEGYTATDIVCRAARMQGKSVLHPMGFDAFGLPAEEHAIKTGEHPRMQTEKNIATFRRQLKMLGFSYDWDRELATTDVEYFRWTQWIFLQIYDTWFDAEQQTGPADHANCRFPPTCKPQGDDAVRDVSGRASAGVSDRSAGELVPGAGHGAGQRRSDRRQERSAAAIPSCGCRCGSGCCGSRPTPTGWRRTSSGSTGPRASRRCSATGSAAAPGRRSISSSAHG